MKFEARHYSVNDLREWHERGELQLTPKFQRRSVWSDKARSYLIDTVIRGLPISKIFMRHDIDPKTKKSIRQIVDGQQRINAILNYLDDGFKISTVHNEKFGGKYYSQLPTAIQKTILEYEVSADVLLGVEDAQVLDIFARLNTYTVKLNRQELRNAKYFGVFKQAVYMLGYEYVDFWLKNGVLTEKEVARMGEAELSSELVILVLDGIQDRKKIDEYYRKLDDNFKSKLYAIRNFRKTMDTITEIMGASLSESNFAKIPMFYSLFGVINKLNSKQMIRHKDYPKVLSVLQSLDNILSSEPGNLSQSDFAFYDASTKHVTDSSRRKIRHDFIEKAILKKLKNRK